MWMLFVLFIMAVAMSLMPDNPDVTWVAFSFLLCLGLPILLYWVGRLSIKKEKP